MFVNTLASLVIVVVVVVVVVVNHAFLRECAMGIFGKYVNQDVRDETQDARYKIQDTRQSTRNS